MIICGETIGRGARCKRLIFSRAGHEKKSCTREDRPSVMIDVGEASVIDSEAQEDVSSMTGSLVRGKPVDWYFFYCSKFVRRLSDSEFVLEKSTMIVLEVVGRG